MQDEIDQTRRCQKLITCVMLQAIRDHQENVRRCGEEEALNKEPGRWILSDNDWPFGFVWCCHMLELSPDRLRWVMDDERLISRTLEAIRAREKKNGKESED